MALIWSAAAPPGGPGGGAGAVGGRGESELGGGGMPSVTLHPPGTAVPGVEGGGADAGGGSECLVGLERWGRGGGKGGGGWGQVGTVI